ncbi:MAG: nucleoside triphosphate pyrophosphohydrolase [Lentisphaeria bacterium]|nr:nucleoside triphosphate pyrophosphohydrolase [Lentisphaeria bacterium]
MNEIDELQKVMRRLRAPDGCPWDREQTHLSLKKCLIGEMAEYLDAVDAADDAGMREELGDLLMQIVLNAVIAEERGAFDLADAARDVTEKMIRRHPHVFSGERAENVSDVLQLWESVKKKEKEKNAPADFVSRLDRIPRNLPAVMRAQKVQKKAAEAGFDWPDEAGVRSKLKEEIRETWEALDAGDPAKIDEELGDLMFTIVNLARFRKGNDASEILQRSTDKFVRRFRFVEEELARSGRTVEETGPEELDRLWNLAKRQEKRSASSSSESRTSE